MRLSYYEDIIEKTTVDLGVTEHNYTGSQCWMLGDGLARYFVHDAMRRNDYLGTSPEVDLGKIYVTGNSGGGMQASLVMVCDTRKAGRNRAGVKSMNSLRPLALSMRSIQHQKDSSGQKL